MPTRSVTISDAIRLFENLYYPTGLSASTAWLGIYQVLLWYEPVNWLGFTELPHIIDADKLRPSTIGRRRRWLKSSVWQERSEAVSHYLAERLGTPVQNLPEVTDLLMKQPEYDGMQRHNTLGIAFVGLVRHILEQFGFSEVMYNLELNAGTVFPGITFPGRSSTPRIDLLGTREGIPKVIISAKWSLRHDRLSDITNECPIYKAAYERIYRGERRDHLPYYVVTNEFDPSRLLKVLNDTCVDGVVHVHKPAIVEVCKLDGRLDRLIDLADFVNLSYSW